MTYKALYVMTDEYIIGPYSDPDEANRDYDRLGVEGYYCKIVTDAYLDHFRPALPLRARSASSAGDYHVEA